MFLKKKKNILCFCSPINTPFTPFHGFIDYTHTNKVITHKIHNFPKPNLLIHHISPNEPRPECSSRKYVCWLFHMSSGNGWKWPRDSAYILGNLQPLRSGKCEKIQMETRYRRRLGYFSQTFKNHAPHRLSSAWSCSVPTHRGSTSCLRNVVIVVYV